MTEWTFHIKDGLVTSGDQIVCGVGMWDGLNKATEDKYGHLISAAPELLASLESIVKSAKLSSEEAEQASAAIKKAKGKRC